MRLVSVSAPKRQTVRLHGGGTDGTGLVRHCADKPDVVRERVGFGQTARNDRARYQRARVGLCGMRTVDVGDERERIDFGAKGGQAAHIEYERQGKFRQLAERDMLLRNERDIAKSTTYAWR